MNHLVRDPHRLNVTDRTELLRFFGRLGPGDATGSAPERVHTTATMNRHPASTPPTRATHDSMTNRVQ
jgi:hypothetical protein